MTLTFESANQILRCDHSNESPLPVLTHGAICFSKFHKMKFGHLVKISFWLSLAVKGLKVLLMRFIWMVTPCDSKSKMKVGYIRKIYLPPGLETRDNAREARPVPRDQFPEHSFQSFEAGCNG